MSRVVRDKQFLNRGGGVPVSLLVLLAVAALVAAALWWSLKRQVTDYTHGGVLFAVDPMQIEGLLLTKQGLQYRFDRLEGGGWSLSGATNDYLDTRAMDALVNILPAVVGGAILPGTETEDRRYDFNGPEAMRLRLFLTGGENLTLALGAINPVTGNYFASHAGRQGCFPVAAPFRDKLFMLPVTVQAKSLLPAFERDQVRELRLTRSGTEHVFKKRDGQWWLQLPGDDMMTAMNGLPAGLVQYQTYYDDRRHQDAEGFWIMASSQALGQLIYETSEIVVRDIKNSRESTARLEQWDLDPPWRQVILRGEGINPDPAAPVTDQFTLAFGPPVADDRVPVLRRGNVMLTDFEAINLLNQDLAALIEDQALNDTALFADRIQLEREGRLLLDGARTGEATTREGRTAWQTEVPPPGRAVVSEHDRHGLSQDMVVNLNRIDVLAVLPPTSEASVLLDRERVRITLTWGQGAVPRQVVLEVGYLAEANLLAAGVDLVRTPDGGPPVGMWCPATGKLLQIPNQLVVTARNMVAFMRPKVAP